MPITFTKHDHLIQQFISHHVLTISHPWRASRRLRGARIRLWIWRRAAGRRACERRRSPGSDYQGDAGARGSRPRSCVRPVRCSSAPARVVRLPTSRSPWPSSSWEPWRRRTARLATRPDSHNCAPYLARQRCRWETTPMGSQESLLRLPGLGVVRRAGLTVNTRIVYPGSGREDA